MCKIGDSDEDGVKRFTMSEISIIVMLYMKYEKISACFQMTSKEKEVKKCGEFFWRRMENLLQEF